MTRSRMVNIRPPSDVYDTFGRLNYKPWYAIAEFVDNATQNFFDFREEIASGQDQSPLLHVAIEYDGFGPSLRVTDDAHGMNYDEFQRALRLNARPPDQSGRSEFGMGLKTAACWFGTRWELASTRLGEAYRLRVVMDLDHLLEHRPDELPIVEEPADPLDHGTTLTIEPLRRQLYGRAIQRVKDTLASMYRFDLMSGHVRISYNQEQLAWEPFELWAEDLGSEHQRTWRQPIQVTVTDPQTGIDHQIAGWVGLLAKMSTRDSGFALFRRGRLILGGPTEGWRPSQVVGSQGSHSWKRMVGELHLDDYPVSFSKDDFRWDGALEELTIDAIASATADYRTKASNLRVRSETRPTKQHFEAQLDTVRSSLDPEGLRRDLGRLLAPARIEPDPTQDPGVRTRALDQAEGPLELTVPLPHGDLTARIYLKDEDPRIEWITLSFAQPDEVDVILNINHPFVAAHSGTEESLGIIQKVALCLALAEKQARTLGEGRIWPDDLRTHMDTFLKHFSRGTHG